MANIPSCVTKEASIFIHVFRYKQFVKISFRAQNYGENEFHEGISTHDDIDMENIFLYHLDKYTDCNYGYIYQPPYINSQGL